MTDEYTLDDLLAVGAPSPPADFARFWTGLYDRARQVDPAPVMRGSGPLRDIEFTSLCGVRIGGWLSLPADGVVERGLVVGHGYGGRAAPDAPSAAIPVERAAVLYFCAPRLACLWVPSFGNHPLRLTIPCTGSGEAVRPQGSHRRPTAIRTRGAAPNRTDRRLSYPQDHRWSSTRTPLPWT